MLLVRILNLFCQAPALLTCRAQHESILTLQSNQINELGVTEASGESDSDMDMERSAPDGRTTHPADSLTHWPPDSDYTARPGNGVATQ
jgi:hypothetical protein